MVGIFELALPILPVLGAVAVAEATVGGVAYAIERGARKKRIEDVHGFDTETLCIVNLYLHLFVPGGVFEPDEAARYLRTLAELWLSRNEEANGIFREPVDWNLRLDDTDTHYLGPKPWTSPEVPAYLDGILLDPREIGAMFRFDSLPRLGEGGPSREGHTSLQLVEPQQAATLSPTSAAQLAPVETPAPLRHTSRTTP